MIYSCESSLCLYITIKHNQNHLIVEIMWEQYHITRVTKNFRCSLVMRNKRVSVLSFAGFSGTRTNKNKSPDFTLLHPSENVCCCVLIVHFVLHTVSDYADSFFKRVIRTNLNRIATNSTSGLDIGFTISYYP